MLYLAQKPDAVLTKLLDDALAMVGDELRDDEDALAAFPDDVAKMFGGPAAIGDVLAALRTAAVDPQAVYDINDYHMILLYFVLEAYCDIYNDTMRDPSLEAYDALAIRVRGKVVPHVDAGTIADVFFPDTDFLLAVDLLDPQVSQEALDAMDYRDTTMAVAARLKPHPDELRLTRVEGAPEWDEEDPDEPPWWRD